MGSTSVSTADLSGKLRIVRSGSSLTTYYYQVGQWVELYSSAASTDDVHIQVMAWSHDLVFADKNVKVAFDNFTVNYGTLLPIYPTVPSVGAVKGLPDGTPVFVEDAIVTAGPVLVPGSVFVEAPDRSSGIRLVTDQSLSIGQRLKLTGVVRRVDGEWQIDAANIFTLSGGAPLAPLGVTTRAVGNDRTETLNYVGINTTGLLVRMCGKVSAVISAERAFYIDDGGAYQDGLGPFIGIRVQVPQGVSLPAKGRHVTVTGISRVRKYTLTTWGEVNSDWYPPGTVIYVPSIWVRDANDIL